MIDRPYMFLAGVALLSGLYLELPALVYAVGGLFLFEGVTDLRVARLFRPAAAQAACPGDSEAGDPGRLGLAADRAWLLIIGLVLLLSYGLAYDQLWFLGWFLGFAIAGAGLSGVCPLLVSLKLAGLK
jgi:hypothetical protein